ncbi:MAG TPA: asparagine synthase (glutamine-hydrolyzing) [Blastocatellia bacterium]|nr:asparagine synthase (glutamine-hydrolyzing) [Blastocatellia bacterium]
MCGIAGILNYSAAPDEQTVRRMLGMIRHRGPDEFGIYLGRDVALGNARLSIVDLSGGQQPIGNEDGSLWIVFNGEIFNHVELRAELEARGHQFSTHCDTEVILHLYEDYGPKCLSRLNGQFAIAIYNERDRSLFLARDRLGVRPVFYTRTANNLIFASEVKAILAHPEVTAEIDPVALDQIFTYWSPLPPRSCFRNIQSLPPGHYLLARNGNIEIAPFWQLTFRDSTAKAAPDLSKSEYVAGFRELLVDATRIRLRADVPVGAYLSGGLDSSTIAAIIKHLGHSHLDTFSIAFSDPKFDESEHQKRMAAFLGTDHQVVYATHADIGRVFPDVIWHTETPIMRTSPAPMFLLSKLVHDRKYKVVLTGEGADEFLAGYDIFKEAMVRRFWARQPDSTRRPKLLQRLYSDISDLNATGQAYLKAFFGSGLKETQRTDYSHFIRWRNNRRACNFFSEELCAAIDRQRSTADSELPLPNGFKTWGPLEQAQALEITIFLSHYLLSSQGDRPAMAHSVEGRFPFLDYRVVEFCTKLPSRLKLNGLTEKYLLRQVAKEWLPAEILARVKRPYRAPIHKSFFNEAKLDYVRELLQPEAVRSAGYFNPAAIAQLVAKIEQNRPLGETDDMALVGIISTQLVHQHFVQDFAAPAAIGEADSVKIVDRSSFRRAA